LEKRAERLGRRFYGRKNPSEETPPRAEIFLKRQRFKGRELLKAGSVRAFISSASPP
jgi:hypothetical protein